MENLTKENKMDVYWCPVCKQLRRFEVTDVNDVQHGVCKECKNQWKGEELEELWDKGSTID